MTDIPLADLIQTMWKAERVRLAGRNQQTPVPAWKASDHDEPTVCGRLPPAVATVASQENAK